jgi:hypothetical protein
VGSVSIMTLVNGGNSTAFNTELRPTLT